MGGGSCYRALLSVNVFRVCCSLFGAAGTKFD